MKLLHLVTLSWALAACQGSSGDNAAPRLSAAEKGADQIPVDNSESTLTHDAATPGDSPAVPVQGPKAELIGYPNTMSNQAQLSIQVSKVANYRWRLAPSMDECSNPAGYSDSLDIAEPIQIDQAPMPDKTNVVLCVIGRDSNGKEQEQPTAVSWQWSPTAPTLGDQISITEVQNGLQIKYDNPTGNWLVMRSPAFATILPESRKDYTPGMTLGNAVIIYSGPVGDFVDSSISYGTTHYYTFYAVSKEKRYSIPLTKSVSVGPQTLTWVSNKNLTADQQVVKLATASGDVYPCRGFLPSSIRYVLPGVLRPAANNSALQGTCSYSTSSDTFYHVLVINRGDISVLTKWQSMGGAAGLEPPAQPVEGGSQSGTDLYLCRAFSNAARTSVIGLGYAISTNLAAGCQIAGGSSYTLYDILVYR